MKKVVFKTIREQTDNFIAVATKKGFPMSRHGVDRDIFGYLPNAEVSTEESFEGVFKTKKRRHQSKQNA